MDPSQGTSWMLNGFKLVNKNFTNVNLGVLTEEKVGQSDRQTTIHNIFANVTKPERTSSKNWIRVMKE